MLTIGNLYKLKLLQIVIELFYLAYSSSSCIFTTLFFSLDTEYFKPKWEGNPKNCKNLWRLSLNKNKNK